MTNVTESEHFDKNMLFEIPLYSNNIEATRVIPSQTKILTSHILRNAAIIEESIDERILSECSPRNNEAAGEYNRIEDSLDTFQRSESFSMT
jgi:hypothetical protein